MFLHEYIHLFWLLMLSNSAMMWSIYPLPDSVLHWNDLDHQTNSLLHGGNQSK